jgi:transposase-like protein
MILKLLITKNERTQKNNIFQSVIADYQTRHFDILKITKEVIEMNTTLTDLFRSRKLLGLFDELLFKFYGSEK